MSLLWDMSQFLGKDLKRSIKSAKSILLMDELSEYPALEHYDFFFIVGSQCLSVIYIFSICIIL